MTEWKKKSQMEKSKILSMLGLARRAGRLSMGHDMAVKSICSGKARLLIFAKDTSKRVQDELRLTISKNNSEIPVYIPDISISEIHFSCGYKAGIITVDDENFSKKIISLLNE